jgi:hypothetical protein
MKHQLVPGRGYARCVAFPYMFPPGGQEDRSRQITPVTRRDVFDYLRTDGRPWWGALSEVAFLGRLYELDRLPSTDHRFRTAAEDIAQHRIRNDDWPNDWVFDDPRFQLASGPDEVLLGFLAQVVHPVVQPSAERAAVVAAELNALLSTDGWELRPGKAMSGRPVYTPARTGTGVLAVSFAHDVAARIDTAYITRLVTRMEGAVDTEPDLAIGTAKELVESICKTILDERSVAYGAGEDLTALVRKTARELDLAGPGGSGQAAETLRRMLMNTASIAQGAAELRNAYGTGHGRSSAQAANGLEPRHARLVAGAAAALAVFLFEAHEARPPGR